MSNWKECRLGDIVDITMGQSPKSEYYNSDGEGTPFLQGNRTFGTRYPLFDTYTTFITKIAKAQDIIMSVRAPVGDVNIAPVELCLGRGVCSLRMKNNNQEYLYYLMKYNRQNLQNKENGTVFGSINSKDLFNLKVYIPEDSKEQKKIAAILSALDDKIELNSWVNANLEQQAQTIYQEYIVSTSNYSKNGIIGDYCSVKSGYAFKSNWWLDDGIRVIKIKSIENKKINLQECSYVSEDKLQLAEEFFVKGGDLLIAMTGATIGKFAIVPQVDEPLLVNQRVGKFFLGNNPIKKLPFIYCTLNNQDIINEIINKGQGSAQPNISGSDILSTPCYYPDNSVITEFNKTCSPLFETIITNQRENLNLAALRDALLPKLMSGEIIV